MKTALSLSLCLLVGQSAVRAGSLEDQLSENARYREEKTHPTSATTPPRPAAEAPTPPTMPSPTAPPARADAPASDVAKPQQPPPPKAAEKTKAAAESSRPWRHLPLDVAAKKYGAKIDKTRIFPDCKKLGTSEPKRGDLFVGSLTIIDIAPYETLPTAKITYRHSSGLTLVMFIPKKFLSDVCVGGIDIARTWCPIRIVMPAKGKYAAEFVPHAGCLDSNGLK